MSMDINQTQEGRRYFASRADMRRMLQIELTVLLGRASMLRLQVLDLRTQRKMPEFRDLSRVDQMLAIAHCREKIIEWEKVTQRGRAIQRFLARMAEKEMEVAA